MFLLSALLSLSAFCYSAIPQNFNGRNFEVVSDLLPEYCFNLNLSYVVTDKLPRCEGFLGDEKPCPRYHHDHPDSVNFPTCTILGEFGPKQCKGQRRTGRCFCFDAEGKRIFGQQWWSAADEMTCACSRRKADMKTWKNPPYFNSLHCDSTGNYEPLQCDVVDGHCWCVDEKTGELTSPIVPEKAMYNLPCYDRQKVGAQYLRQCESRKYAQTKILHQLKLRGTVGATFGQLLCDDDGSFGPYTIVNSLSSCTWRDNTRIGSWQGDSVDINVLNCNCARDFRIFAEAQHTLTQACTGFGNYQTLQKSGNVSYCLDIDGFNKSPTNANVVEEANCDNYPSYNQ